MWQGWRDHRMMRKMNRDRIRTIAEICEQPGIHAHEPDEVAVIRLLSDESLHAWLGRPMLGADTRIAMERELRRREAWAAPAGRAARISGWALVISALALVVSVMALWLK